MTSRLQKRHNSNTPAALYVGKHYANTLVLYVDLHGDGLSAPRANLTHPARDLYSAGTFLNATLFVEPDCDVLNDLVDVPSYREAVRACKHNPLQDIASVGMDINTPTSKTMLLDTIHYLKPNTVVFQGFAAKQLFKDKTFKRQLQRSCKQVFVVAHPTHKGLRTPMQAMAHTSMQHVQQYMMS